VFVEGHGHPAWERYVAPRDEFIELIRSLDDEQLTTRVPMCPSWTVLDVARHVCGLNAELVAGVSGRLGSDEATARQVATRAAASASDVCEEWLGYGPEMEAICTAEPLWATRLSADLVVHFHDVRHALGLPIERDDDATIGAAHQYVDVFQQRVGEISKIGVTVELTDGFRRPADPALPDSGIVLRTTPYDFLRSYTGRRSRRQVEELGWRGDPSSILDEAWSPYGEFQHADVAD
jgi:uncharacterized protein (TIGR03083 family)